MAGGFDLDWLPSTHTNNKRAIFRPGEEEDEEEEEVSSREITKALGEGWQITIEK